jgi:hypothetical protein
MTIAAILDLDQAIETFKNKTQPLLPVQDLSNWDGTILQKRGQGIRHTALELVGQCITLPLQRILISGITPKPSPDAISMSHSRVHMTIFFNLYPFLM